MGRPGCRQCCDEDILICVIDEEINYYDTNSEILGLTDTEIFERFLIAGEENPLVNRIEAFQDSDEFKIQEDLIDKVKAGSILVFEEFKTPQRSEIKINKGNPLAFDIDVFPVFSEYIIRSEVYNSEKSIFARTREILFEEEEEGGKFFDLRILDQQITSDVEVGNYTLNLQVAQDVLNVRTGNRLYSFNLGSEISNIPESGMDNFTASLFFSTSKIREFLDGLGEISADQFIATSDSIFKIKVFNKNGSDFTNLVIMDIGLSGEFIARYRDHRVVGGTITLKEEGVAFDTPFEDIVDKINLRNYGAVPSIENALNIYKDSENGPEDYEALVSLSSNSFNIVIPKRSDNTELYTQEEITEEIELVLTQSDELDNLFFDVNEDGDLIEKQVTENTISEMKRLFYISLSGNKASIIQEETNSSADSIVQYINHSGNSTSIKEATPISQIVLVNIQLVKGGAFESKFSYVNEANIAYTKPVSNNNTLNILVNGYLTTVSCIFIDSITSNNLTASISGRQIYCDGVCSGNITSLIPSIQHTKNTTSIQYGDDRWDYIDEERCVLTNQNSCFTDPDCAKNIVPEGFGICNKECGSGQTFRYDNAFAVKTLGSFNIVDQNHSYDFSYYAEGLECSLRDENNDCTAFNEVSFFSNNYSGVEGWRDSVDFSSGGIYYLDKKVYPTKVLEVFKSNSYTSQWPATFYEKRLLDFDVLGFSEFDTSKHYDQFGTASEDSLYLYKYLGGSLVRGCANITDSTIGTLSALHKDYDLYPLQNGSVKLTHTRHEQIGKKYKIQGVLNNNSIKEIFEDEFDYIDLIKNGEVLPINESMFKRIDTDCSFELTFDDPCYEKIDINGFKSCGSPRIGSDFYSAEDTELPDFYVNYFSSQTCNYFPIATLPILTDSNFTISYTNPTSGILTPGLLYPEGEVVVWKAYSGYRPSFFSNDEIPEGKCASHRTRVTGERPFGTIMNSGGFFGYSIGVDINQNSPRYGRLTFHIATTPIGIPKCSRTYECGGGGDIFIESIDSASGIFYVIDQFSGTILGSQSVSCGELVDSDLLELARQPNNTSVTIVQSATITWGRVGGGRNIVSTDGYFFDCNELDDPITLDTNINMESAILCGQYSNFEVTIK